MLVLMDTVQGYKRYPTEFVILLYLQITASFTVLLVTVKLIIGLVCLRRNIYFPTRSRRPRK